MISPCSAKRRASDKDLPVRFRIFSISGHNDCQECEAKFYGKHSKKDLNHHKRTKHPELQNKCSICNKSIHRKYLAKHIANKHSEQKPEFECSTCERIFVTKDKAQFHMKYAHGKKKQTRKHKPLIFYKKISKGEVKFVCVKCKVSFNNENEVNIHFKRVHIMKRDSNDSELVQNVNEYEHVQSEYEYIQNEYEQVQSEHVQSERKALQTFNKRIIKGIVKFECATCGELFDSKVEMTAHFKSVHEEKNKVHENKNKKKGYEERKEYECPNCEETFKNRFIFKKHCDIYHGDLISVLNSPKKVKTHFETDTNEESFECQICVKTFENEWILTNHFNTVHSDRVLEESISEQEYSMSEVIESNENTNYTIINGLLTIIPSKSSESNLDESVNHLDGSVNYFYGESDELNDQKLENIELEQTDQKIEILKNLEFENIEELSQNFQTVIETKPDEPNTYVICETNLYKNCSVQEEKISEFKNRNSIKYFKENISVRPEKRTISNSMVSKSNQDQRVYRNENGVCIVSFAKKVVNESQKLSENPDGKIIIYKSEDNVENMSESEMKDPLLE